MSGPVLLVGGPMDGVRTTSLDPKGPVVVNVPSAALAQAIRDGAASTDPADEPFVHVTYLPKILDFFGTRIRVHVAEGTPAERWEASLAACLLSDTAKELIM